MSLDLSDCSDGELAALALAGRQAAYSMLMQRHRDVVYRILRGLVGDGDAALELTQQAFIAAFGALKRFDGDRPFQAWIARIAVNKARDWARRRKVRRFFTFARPIDEALTIADPAAGSDLMLADRAELQRAMTAIAQLSPGLKDVLVLRTIEGMSQAETAEILGISAKAVETRLYRARMKLQEMLRD